MGVLYWKLFLVVACINSEKLRLDISKRKPKFPEEKGAVKKNSHENAVNALHDVSHWNFTESTVYINESAIIPFTAVLAKLTTNSAVTSINDVQMHIFYSV